MLTETSRRRSFPSLDGCNTCTCGPDGAVSCTEIACACDPAKEWWRHYVALDPASCAAIDYACPPNTTMFSNACGCGCEEDASCPPFFDCEPPATCDPAALMANRQTIAARYVDTSVADDSSLARGERMFNRLCVPCHGPAMQGNGPVAARFMPPPDLLGAQTRGRTDGYIYTYIRFGGAIMPKYGHALTVSQSWDVIHFLRQSQKVSPR